MNTPLTGSSQAVSLGAGYALRAPGLSGQAEALMPTSAAGPTGSARALARPFAGGMGALDVALTRADVVKVRDIVVELKAPSDRSAVGPSRGMPAAPMLELEVPDAGPGHGQVVMSVDEMGVVHWHFAEPDVMPAPARASRGQGGGKRFRIPVVATRVPAASPSTAAGGTQRSLLGQALRRVLKVFVYPLTDALIGGAGALACRQWEARHRPYGLRRFTPTNHTHADAAALLDEAAIAAMAAQGPMLLFVHGTFSTAHAAFGDLPVATMAALSEAYGGRVIAFDHPSLSEDPLANVRWLLAHLPRSAGPAGAPLVFDVISHSRGGLVARCLAGHAAGLGVDTGHVHVRRLLMAGVPNAGTLLADPAHMVDLVDRMTTLLNWLPGGPAVETLEAVVMLVKVLAHGLLSGLDGLACMHPQGDFLAALNEPGLMVARPSLASGSERFAVAADFGVDGAGQERGWRTLVSSTADGLADRVFGGQANDLIVPTGGVHGANGHPDFPLPDAHTLLFAAHEGVSHTGLFGQPALSERLLHWLGAKVAQPVQASLAPAS